MTALCFKGKREHVSPSDGVPRTGNKSGICSSVEAECLNSTCLWNSALLKEHGDLDPARLFCNGARNSRKIEGTRDLVGLWGVREGWQPCSSKSTDTKSGSQVSKSANSK